MRQLGALPFDEAGFMEKLGVDALHGERGYSTLERRWVRPTYDINGIWGGYQGEGGKRRSGLMRLRKLNQSGNAASCAS